MKTLRLAALGMLAMAAILLSPTHADAWWRGGVWVEGPGPIIVGPPVVYPPPPVYYAPPPVVYAPPPQVYDPQADAQAAVVGSCAAGAYVCPLARPLPVNSACSCPANRGGRVAGMAR
jgi:hypothetical protein